MWKSIKDQLNEMFIGREDEINSLIISYIIGANILFVGKPGTAKTALAKAFSEIIDTKFYTHLMTKETSVSELFGPYSIKSYKELDRYIRIRKGTILEADVAFLDEIFKCNSATLNALLNALNERVYKEEGVEHAIPLRMTIGASNELPEGPELNALYDRFLFKHEVRSLEFEERAQLATKKQKIPERVEGDIDSLTTKHHILNEVTISSDILDKYWKICSQLKFAHGIEVSERRDLQIFKALKANAFLHGRQRVEDSDFVILEHMMWTKPEQKRVISDVVSAIARPSIVRIRKLHDSMLDLYKRANQALASYGSPDEVLLAINKDKNDIITEASDIVKLTPVPEILEYNKKIEDFSKKIVNLIKSGMGLNV